MMTDRASTVLKCIKNVKIFKQSAYNVVCFESDDLITILFSGRYCLISMMTILHLYDRDDNSVLRKRRCSLPIWSISRGMKLKIVVRALEHVKKR